MLQPLRLNFLKVWKAKSTSQKCAFFYKMFANSARVDEPTSVTHVFEFQFFSQFCRNFAIEFDKIRKISKNVEKLGSVFEKKLDFLKKT